MNFTNFKNFIQYLKEKKDKKRSEVFALQALENEDFMNEYDEINFAHHIQQFQQVLDDPGSFDKHANEAHRAYYDRVIKEITTTFSSYLYDNKVKYSNLKGEIDALEKRISDANSDLDNIKETNELISGAEILVAYAKEFKTRSENYEKEAKKWMDKLYSGFVVLSGLVLCFFYFNILNFDFLKTIIAEDLLFYGYIAAITIKALILLGVIQLIRFFYRNYNANKHLANQSLHKHDVLRSLQGVYSTIDSENKEARDELIKTGALTAFQNTESGYITTKEGAGSTDIGLSSVVASLLRK